MSIHVTHQKCPVCKYEYKDEFSDQTPVGTKILKGDKEFVYLQGSWHYASGIGRPSVQVRLLACPKCRMTQLDCPEYYWKKKGT